MITKERLEELIEQGATIYEVDTFGVHTITLKQGDYVEKNGVLHTQVVVGGYNYFYTERLFETKGEAEWHAEFGCIERTERLDFPTWEEFWNLGQTIWFTGKDGGQYGLSIYKREILLNDTYIGYLDKENYTLACRKCKELFLGE